MDGPGSHHRPYPTPNAGDVLWQTIWTLRTASDQWIVILPRALERHDLSRAQILLALYTPVYDEPLPDEPTRWLVLGEDPAGRPLEVIVVQPIPGQPWVVIHAMPLWYPKLGRKSRHFFDLHQAAKGITP